MLEHRAPPHQTPTITGVGDVSYTYVTATNHFRAGPIAKDGLVYVGAFREPGNAGHFFAISDDDRHDACGTRPTRSDATPPRRGTSTPCERRQRRLELLQRELRRRRAAGTLLVSDAATAAVGGELAGHSARFGLTSAPRPRRAWKTRRRRCSARRAALLVRRCRRRPRSSEPRLDATCRLRHRAGARPRRRARRRAARLLHQPADAADAKQRHTRRGPSSPTTWPSGCSPTRPPAPSTAYPDGSPTLVNAKINGAWRTVAHRRRGQRRPRVFALDVTETVDPQTGAVTGPTPLWQFSDANMGRTYSKPTVVRTKVGGVETVDGHLRLRPGPRRRRRRHRLRARPARPARSCGASTSTTPTAYVSTDITAAETDDAGTARRA